MSDSPIYPMYPLVCDYCGDVGTLWEKPGTGTHYMKYCPVCGRKGLQWATVNNYEEWKDFKQMDG